MEAKTKARFEAEVAKEIEAEFKASKLIQSVVRRKQAGNYVQEMRGAQIQSLREDIKEELMGVIPSIPTPISHTQTRTQSPPLSSLQEDGSPVMKHIEKEPGQGDCRFVSQPKNLT